MIISENKPTVVLAVGIGVVALLSTVVEAPFEMENIPAKHRYTNNNLAICLFIFNHFQLNLNS